MQSPTGPFIRGVGRGECRHDLDDDYAPIRTFEDITKSLRRSREILRESNNRAAATELERRTNAAREIA